MISWTIATTGVETTSYFSSLELETTSLTRTASSTTESEGYSNTFTSSESGSGATSRATIRSANETGTSQTLSTDVQGAYDSQSGATDAYPDTTLFYSGQYEPPSTFDTYPQLVTTSGARTYFSEAQVTSTVTTLSASKFGPIQSSSAVPSGFVTASQSVGILVTTSEQDGATVPATTTAWPTFWFFASTSTAQSATVTTTQSATTSGVLRATIYQAGGNEVLYRISSPSSYEQTGKAARSLAETATRVTIFPVRNTAALGSLTVTATSDATSSETAAATSAASRGITQYGPDGQQSVAEYHYTTSTTQTQTTPANYAYTQSSTNPDITFSDSTLSDTQQVYGETQVALSVNRFAAPSWVASLITGFSPDTYQYRYGKTAWDIAGQKGSNIQPASLEELISPHTGSFTRGQITIANVTNQSVTLNVPSITYKTTVGTAATTASTLIGVQGSPESVGELIAVEHLGGGEFAQSWTVIDRVLPECVYNDLRNSQTTSHAGNDTSYSEGQSVAVSHLTFEPHLLGGGLANGNAPAPDAIVWSEQRNPPDPA